MKNGRATVSIVIPVYNTEKYIEATLESVVKQTYGNMEVICIDDASPDKAIEIAKRYSDKYPYIKILRNEKNLGLEGTRNRGIEEASGKYITFLDSDDTIEPEMIASMVECAELKNYNIVISSYKRVTKAGITIINPPVKTGEYSKSCFLEEALEGFSGDVISCVGTKLYRLQFINECGLRFDRYYKYNEDMGFILEAIDRTNEIYFINKPFYNYMIRTSGSIMSSYRPNMFLSIIHIWEKYRMMFEKENLTHSKRKELCKHEYLLMLASLINEYTYGERKRFNETMQTIRQYIYFNEVCNYIAFRKGMSSKHRFIALLMKYNCVNTLYKVVSLRKESERI